jgi:serine/threonine protein kinase
LKKIDHPNVLRFFKLLKTSNHIYLVYEFCSEGSLEDYIIKKKFISEEESLLLIK